MNGCFLYWRVANFYKTCFLSCKFSSSALKGKINSLGSIMNFGGFEKGKQAVGANIVFLPSVQGREPVWKQEFLVG